MRRSNRRRHYLIQRDSAASTSPAAYRLGAGHLGCGTLREDFVAKNSSPYTDSDVG